MPETMNGKHATQSMNPPEAFFGYTAHAMMIPPFSPKSMLVLGWGEGTVPWLTRKIWGEGFQIRGCDIREPKEAWTEIMERADPTIKFLVADAQAYVKSCEPSDFVMVDIYNGSKIPSFVFSPDFIVDVWRATKKLLCINCTFHDFKEFDVYDTAFDLDIVKQVNRDRVLFFNPKIKPAPLEVAA